MLISEIRELTVDDINARLNDLERERFNLKFKAGTEPLEDPLRLRVIRKDIARLKTVLQEKKTTTAGARMGAKAAAR